MDKKFICPCCGKHNFKIDNNFEVCPVCKWIDDGVQRDNPDIAGCGNKLSLNEFKQEWTDRQLIQEISQHEETCGTQLSIETLKLLEKIKNRLSQNELKEIPQ